VPGGKEAVAPLHFDRPETPAGGAMTVVTALAEGATGRASHGAVARQQVSDPVRQCWAPCEGDLEEVEAQIKDDFNRHASSQQLGEHVLNKSDFFRLLGDIPPVDIGDDPEPRQLTHAQLSDIFDEVQNTAQNGTVFSKGLTFESFRLALMKTAMIMGLHFRHLVDDAIDAKV
jgi:hypothetical protein